MIGLWRFWHLMITCQIVTFCSPNQIVTSVGEISRTVGSWWFWPSDSLYLMMNQSWRRFCCCCWCCCVCFVFFVAQLLRGTCRRIHKPGPLQPAREGPPQDGTLQPVQELIILVFIRQRSCDAGRHRHVHLPRAPSPRRNIDRKPHGICQEEELVAENHPPLRNFQYP